MKISEHISYKEAIKSQTAINRDIINYPEYEQLQKMKLIAEKIFEPVRNNFNIPIGLSSFFRCKKLNMVIGGSPNSQHCKGEAIDIDADIYNFKKLTNADIFFYIMHNLEFDQLIWEFGNNSSPDWVHVSYKKDKNRHSVIKSERINGKIVYKSI